MNRNNSVNLNSKSGWTSGKESKSKRILIVHSEGSICTNPSLHGIVEILCGQGYQVDIVSPRRKGIPQNFQHPGARFILLDNPAIEVGGMFVLLESHGAATEQQFREQVNRLVGEYDLILGVDRSIVEAYMLAAIRGIPYGLLSYEIFFADETSNEFKAPEIQACRALDFAICTDELRARHLCRENQISPDKIILMPVAGRGVCPRDKNNLLYQQFGISPDKKIALFTGSVGKFCMSEEIARSVDSWPQDWVLVLHNCHGMDNRTKHMAQRYEEHPRIYFSRQPMDTTQQMGQLLNGADIGIAFYQPDYSIWTGKNVCYLGLASGKIASYLQHGLPIFINEVGQFSDFVRQYHLGLVYPGNGPIYLEATGDQLQQWSQNTQPFFKQFLDLDVTSRPLIERIDRLLKKETASFGVVSVSDNCPKPSQSVEPDKADSVSRSQIYIKGSIDYPKITVVTPSFNQRKYLEDCIQSVLSQGYPNLEYIIMDGGSTDGSVEIIKKYEKYFAYWQSQEDGGQYAAIEAGFHRSTGSIMTWLNSDDMFLPKAFFMAAGIFINRSRVRWIMGRPIQFNADGTVCCAEIGPVRWCRAKYLKREIDGYYIQQEGTFWRRDLWEQAGGYMDKSKALAGDLELWARFFRYADLYSLDEHLAGFRYQPDQKTNRLLEQYNQEAVEVLDREFREYLSQPKETRKPLEAAPEPISSIEIRGYLRAMEVEPDSVTIPPVESDIQVSAIISVYNSEKYMCGCLHDLVNQTLFQKGRMEIVIVNSGSKQNEHAIIEEFRQQYPNIQYIKTEQRETIYEAWNRAVRAARGKYLTNANTDDRHRDDALEIMANELDQNPGIALVYGDQIISHIANAEFPDLHGERICKPDYSPARLKQGCCVGSQPMWRRSLHDEFGYFDETLTVAADWDFWLRISSKYPFKRIPEFIGMYYHNEEGIEHGRGSHSLYERYIVGKRYGTPYISTIPLYKHRDNPLISIIMPAYNAANHIREAIESVLIQNYPNLELIVFNDGSTDHTEQVVESFRDPRIRYFAGPNGGPSAARNQAIRQSRGQYIVILDHDDMMTPDFVIQHLQAFDQNPDADLIYCDDLLMDENLVPKRIIKRDEYSDTRHLIGDLFQKGYPVIPFRTCIRRRVFEEIGLYDETLRVAEDYDMLRRFLQHGMTVRHLPGAFYLRRMTSGSLSRVLSSSKAQMHLSVVKRYLETFDGTELFPDVTWDQIPADQKDFFVRYLAGKVFISLAQQYQKAGSDVSLIETACAFGLEQLDCCEQAAPGQAEVAKLRDQCLRLTSYATVS